MIDETVVQHVSSLCETMRRQAPEAPEATNRLQRRQEREHPRDAPLSAKGHDSSSAAVTKDFNLAVFAFNQNDKHLYVTSTSRVRHRHVAKARKGQARREATLSRGSANQAAPVALGCVL
jgi:hypothetical protein